MVQKQLFKLLRLSTLCCHDTAPVFTSSQLLPEILKHAYHFHFRPDLVPTPMAVDHTLSLLLGRTQFMGELTFFPMDTTPSLSYLPPSLLSLTFHPSLSSFTLSQPSPLSLSPFTPLSPPRSLASFTLPLSLSLPPSLFASLPSSLLPWLSLSFLLIFPPSPPFRYIPTFL